MELRYIFQGDDEVDPVGDGEDPLDGQKKDEFMASLGVGHDHEEEETDVLIQAEETLLADVSQSTLTGNGKDKGDSGNGNGGGGNSPVTVHGPPDPTPEGEEGGISLFEAEALFSPFDYCVANGDDTVCEWGAPPSNIGMPSRNSYEGSHFVLRRHHVDSATLMTLLELTDENIPQEVLLKLEFGLIEITPEDHDSWVALDHVKVYWEGEPEGQTSDNSTTTDSTSNNESPTDTASDSEAPSDSADSDEQEEPEKDLFEDDFPIPEGENPWTSHGRLVYGDVIPTSYTDPEDGSTSEYFLLGGLTNIGRTGISRTFEVHTPSPEAVPEMLEGLTVELRYIFQGDDEVDEVGDEADEYDGQKKDEFMASLALGHDHAEEESDETTQAGETILLVAADTSSDAKGQGASGSGGEGGSPVIVHGPPDETPEEEAGGLSLFDMEALLSPFHYAGDPDAERDQYKTEHFATVVREVSLQELREAILGLTEDEPLPEEFLLKLEFGLIEITPKDHDSWAALDSVKVHWGSLENSSPDEAVVSGASNIQSNLPVLLSDFTYSQPLELTTVTFEASTPQGPEMTTYLYEPVQIDLSDFMRNSLNEDWTPVPLSNTPFLENIADTQVPEPTPLLLVGIGLLGLLGLRRKR